MLPVECQFENYFITTDLQKMDVPAVHAFLSHDSGWARNIPFDVVRKSMDNSLNFGLFHNDHQIGFARVISDYATIAYLGDFYILGSYRGRGLAKRLMDVIIKHPQLQGLRRWILLTSTADWLYEKYGFSKPLHPEWYMERHETDLYTTAVKQQRDDGKKDSE